MTAQQREFILRTILITARALTWPGLIGGLLLWSLALYDDAGHNIMDLDLQEMAYFLSACLLALSVVGAALYWVHAFIKRGNDHEKANPSNRTTDHHCRAR